MKDCFSREIGAYHLSGNISSGYCVNIWFKFSSCLVGGSANTQAGGTNQVLAACV